MCISYRPNIRAAQISMHTAVHNKDIARLQQVKHKPRHTSYRRRHLPWLRLCTVYSSMLIGPASLAACTWLGQLGRTLYRTCLSLEQVCTRRIEMDLSPMVLRKCKHLMSQMQLVTWTVACRNNGYAIV